MGALSAPLNSVKMAESVLFRSMPVLVRLRPCGLPCFTNSSSTVWLISACSSSLTFGRYAPGAGRNYVVMKVNVAQPRDTIRGVTPDRLLMKGARAADPVETVYPIAFTDPRLCGGVRNSDIRKPRFYQPPRLLTKRQFAL